MLNDTVNTLTFEFTCSSEQVAKTMRNEIINYTASQVNAILSDVLKRNFDSNLIWKINKLEIDLGNINLNEINNGDLIYKFKNLLVENIEENLRSLHKESHNNTVTLPQGKAMLEMIKEVLISGDLPWWIDKTKFLSVDHVLQIVMAQNETELKLFLNAQMNNSAVKHRLKLFCSPETLLLLNKIAPGTTNPVIPFTVTGEKISLKNLSGANLHQILASFNKSIKENLKSLLIQELLGNIYSLLPGLTMLGVLSKNEETNVASIPDKKTVLPVLQNLCIFQLEFLSQQFSDKTNEPLGNVNQKEALSILKQLKTENPPILGHLNSASAKSLKLLKNSFGQYKSRATSKAAMINKIIRHPHFLEFNLLKIFHYQIIDSAHSADADELLELLAINQRFRKIQTNLRKETGKLTKGQSADLGKALLTGELSSTSTQKTLSKLLNNLSTKDLQMISGLLLLNKDEIESILQTRAESETSDNIKKTIIENAGLCILAPYLPSFFHQLGYTEKSRFKTKAMANRAMYLLQYIVNGRQRNYEYIMQFNKLLCGLKPDEPVSNYKRLTRVERNETEDLITSVISHWKALKSTSKKGFQLSFLQRKGILTEKEDFWTLQVEKNTYDLLLDSIPWSFNIIKLPWMNKMIQVEW